MPPGNEEKKAALAQGKRQLSAVMLSQLLRNRVSSSMNTAKESPSFPGHFVRGKHRIRLATERKTGRARTHFKMKKRSILWQLQLSGIKEAGSSNKTQQNSKPQQRIPERFSTQSSIFPNKSANFSSPVFSHKPQFFTGGPF